MNRPLVIAIVVGISGTSLAQYRSEPIRSPGEIAGQVSYAGAPPALPPEQRDKNPEVCGSTHPNETLEIGPGGGLANVVVYLQDIHAGEPIRPVTADLNQVGCSYVPHVQAVPVGSTLNLLNGDPVLHNIHATEGGGTAFNYAMPRSVRKIPKKLVRPGFLTLKCDVHGWMNGVVAVLDSPYFAVTDSSGAFRIANVPAGTYTLAAWQERLGEKTQPVIIRGRETTKASFSFSGQ